ncbi:hypothetical protein LLEC1_07152 [Akanthomyces lecanii]|uniref:ABC transporter domain-containing protein n=1 Tax=Cordyceps confragosa TaxID=2714763 RepID=A0A179IB87_CORDF|nr:hypothetical protein LLEC1_07152 [Akanthomyces lecanii]
MASVHADQAFWPPQKAILDLTLTFEDVILKILLSGIFLVISPIVIRHYLRSPLYVRPSLLLWTKLTVTLALVGTLIVRLVFRAMSSHFRPRTALPATALDLLAVIAVGAVVHLEHRRAIGTSAFSGVYLFFSIVADIIMSRSFLIRPGLTTMGALTAAAVALRAVLLGLQELSKRNLLMDPRLNNMIGAEVVSGFWSRSFFAYLYPLLTKGFRGALVLSELHHLGPDFAASVLYPQLKYHWEKTNRVSSNSLFLSCICSWKLFFASIALPRLGQSACTLAQPFILHRTILVIGDETVGNIERAFLLIATILSFGGAVVCKTMTAHLSTRLNTRIRGALISQMFDKSLRISQSEAKKSAAITLMSADIEGIASGLPQIYELIMTLVELGLGIYILSLFVGHSCFVVLAPLVASAIGTYFIGNWMATAFAAWNKSIEIRVSKTSKVIDQLKAIKMFGLGPTISIYLQKLREVETASSNKFRALQSASVVAVLCAEFVTPVVVIAAALFWNTFSGRLSAATVFPSLSIVALIKDPLSLLLGGYPTMKAMFSCFERIQNFLKLEERKDPRTIRSSVHDNQDLEPKCSSYPVVEFSGASVAPVGTQTPILKNLDFALLPGSVTAAVGINGCGKSLMLQSILGEAEIPDGRICLSETDVAVCGQTVWLRNATIKENVVGPLPYDEALFRKVMHCCLLDQDLESLPLGADYVVGSGGARLSGGQRQRVGLARALYARKALVLLDDVFSSLDHRTAVSILFRLCGGEGMLRESQSTVVFCTFLPECLDVVDPLIVFDGDGHASLEANSSDKDARLEMIRSLNPEQVTEAENDAVQKQEPEKAQLKSASSSGEKNETTQKGDVRLYWLFIDPIGRYKLLLWAAVMCIGSILELAPDVYMRLWIEHAAENNLFFIGYALIAVVAVFIFIGAVAVFLIKLMPRASLSLHQQLVDTVLRATLAFLGTTDNGIMINRFSQDMTLIIRALVITFIRTTTMFFTTTIQAGIIASGSSYMAIILPFIAVAVYFIQRFYLRTSRQVRAIDLETKSPLYTHFQETTEGLVYIRAFGWQKANLEEAFKFLDDSQRGVYYMDSIQQWLQLVLGLLSTVIAAVLMTLTLFVTKSTSETAVGLSFLNLILFGKTMEQLISAWTGLETSVGALARLRDFMKDTPQESNDRRRVVPRNWPSQGAVELADVTARYRYLQQPTKTRETKADSASSDDSHLPPILKSISLSISAGQKVGVVGRTGSGKSSLFLALLGFLQYDGTIKIDGIDISQVPLDELRSRVVTISQDQIKLDASVRRATKKKSQEAERQDIMLKGLLTRLGIWGPLENKGLDAMLDDVGYSHGQMQLFCLARGIVRYQDTGSKVVLIDEATSSVEQGMEKSAQDIMKEYFADCTVLIIGHRESSIRDVELTVELSRGEIVRAEPSQPRSDEAVSSGR